MSELPILATPALPRELSFSLNGQTLYCVAQDDRNARVWLRGPDKVLRIDCRRAELLDWLPAGLRSEIAARLERKRPAGFAGFRLDRPLLMGIVNVTPNSFSDGGRYLAAEDAIAHGRSLAAAGADILDVGGESTRPGAEPVPLAEELARVLPVVTALSREGHCVSIDTRHAPVMRAALAAGAKIVNDVSALTTDADSMDVVAESGAPVILMHMQGEPQTMQQEPRYLCAPLDVYNALAERVEACEKAGIARDRICLDPGIGFGKGREHNLALLNALDLLGGQGLPILLGVSRKSFIAALSRNEPADQRLPGSLAAALLGLDQGVQILRVHDIAETAQAVAVWRALKTSS